MPESSDLPQIDSILFTDRALVIEFVEPRNIFGDGGMLGNRAVIPLEGREDAVNEILDDAMQVLDEYLKAARSDTKPLRGRPGSDTPTPAVNRAAPANADGH